MIFSRSESKFKTRLHVNNITNDQKPVNKILGVWLSEDLSWTTNTKEICVKAYSRMGMITKLKYVCVKTEDLLDIYALYIRSVVEYCSVPYHSRLTQADSAELERIQITSFRVN